jgi:hypothetical protein
MRSAELVPFLQLWTYDLVVLETVFKLVSFFVQLLFNQTHVKAG